MFVIKDQTNAGSIVINNFSHCVYQSLRLQVATLTKSLRLQVTTFTLAHKLSFEDC
jgi:hypothetical protein